MRMFVISAMLVASVGGCASVTRGVTNNLQFESEPSGAEVRTVFRSVCDGPCPTTDPNENSFQAAQASQVGPACVTPCQVQVKRSQELIATFTKAGYAPVSVEVKTRVAGEGAVGFAGNVLIGGVVGGVVDAASGATLEHYPNPVKVELRPIATAPKPPRKRL